MKGHLSYETLKQVQGGKELLGKDLYVGNYQ